MKLTQLIPLFVVFIFIFSTVVLFLDGVPLNLAIYWVLTQIVGQYIEIPIKNFYMRGDVVFLSAINFIAYMLLIAYASSIFYSYFSTIKISKIFKRIAIKRLSKHVILVLEDNFGMFIAKELKEREVPFVIIEKRKKVAESLSSKYLVINGSPLEKEVLEEAGIKKASIIIASTKSSFDNALIVVTAKAINPRIYAIARANSIEEMQRLYRSSSDSVIIPEINGAYELAKQLLLI
jgi:voltage-gated potassium channel